MSTVDSDLELCAEQLDVVAQLIRRAAMRKHYLMAELAMQLLTDALSRLERVLVQHKGR